MTELQADETQDDVIIDEEAKDQDDLTPEVDETSLDGEDSPSSEEEAPKKTGIPRRVKRLLEKNEALNAENGEVAGQLEATLAENALMREVLLQNKAPKAADLTRQPKLEDYDYDDDKFQAANAKYIENMVTQQVSNQLTTQSQTQTIQAREIKASQARGSHYDRADSLKVTDYDSAEESAITILGDVFAKGLIENVQNSEAVMYFLGKNPDEALKLRRLNDTDPVAATLELGRLSAKQTARPKKSQNEIEPEVKLSGGKGGAGLSESALRKQLDKAREEAVNGDLSQVKALRDEMRAQGYKP